MRLPINLPAASSFEPISVDLPDWLMKDFLSRIYTPFPPSSQGRFHFKTTSHKIYIRLYAFYQNFKIEEGIKSIQDDMKIHAAEEPWTYLILGSRYNSTELASLALSNMTPEKLADRHFWRNIDMLRPDWRSAFLSSISKRTPPVFDGSKTTLVTEDDVKMIEARFLQEVKGDLQVKEEEEVEKAEVSVFGGKKRKEWG